MSAKRIAMRKPREVLKLRYSAELSIRQISASTNFDLHRKKIEAQQRKLKKELSDIKNQ